MFVPNSDYASRSIVSRDSNNICKLVVMKDYLCFKYMYKLEHTKLCIFINYSNTYIYLQLSLKIKNENMIDVDHYTTICYKRCT